MITQTFAEHFAAEWISAWNARDLERILAHYSSDFEMSSPFIKEGTPVVGRLKGKPAVSAYWRAALAKLPELRFELLGVYCGVDSLCLHYKSVLGLTAVEWLHFDAEGKVDRAMAHYDRLMSLG